MTKRVIQSANGEGARADKLREGADTAIRLLQDIKAHRIDPRDLSADQRRACLMLTANGAQTSTELAAMFKVAPSTIRKDLKLIREELGREVKEFTLEEVLGQLAFAKEKCAAHAMRQEDAGLAWTIERDFVKLLKELGVVGPQEKRDSLTVTIESLGQGYERARHALGRALDPRLTGRVLEVQAEDSPKGVPSLPLDRRFTGQITDQAEEDQDHSPEETEHDLDENED